MIVRVRCNPANHGYRKRVVCRQGADDTRPLFQSFPMRGEVTLDDAKDIYEICRYVKDPAQKIECYAMWGLDGHNVEKYLKQVENFEKCFEYAKQQEQKNTCSWKFNFWGWVIYVCKEHQDL